MENQPAFQSDDENNIVKRSIQVKPATSRGSLHRMSRLNFGKIYTIEHNVETRDIGQVTQKSLVWLTKYFEEELKRSFS